MTIYDSLVSTIHEEYDIVKLLKQNDRGQVSVVRHKDSGTRYIFRLYKGNCEVYQRLLPVSCPYLPRIMEVGQVGSSCAVLEEYIQGDTLDSLLEVSLMNERQARRVMQQLCSALWVLHSMGAVHRDIKPDNVIIRGSDAVLIDFDASRIYKHDLAKDTTVLGTVGFAAPKQFGLSQTDSQTDIYALGILLNIMLTAKHPSAQLASGKMGRIVQKCTMMNPQKRYKSVLHLIEAL